MINIILVKIKAKILRINCNYKFNFLIYDIFVFLYKILQFLSNTNNPTGNNYNIFDKILSGFDK